MHEPGAREPLCERDLVVVDRLAEVVAARHHDRPAAEPEGDADRADACVADERPRLRDELLDLLERHERPAVGEGRLQLRGAALDDHLLCADERAGGRDQTIEGLLVGAGADEDHQAPNTLPAKRARRTRGASSGHWTYSLLATGAIMRMLSDGPSMRVMLST